MKEKKKTPIIYARRIIWVRYERRNSQTGHKETRLVQLWQNNTTGDLRLYIGRMRWDRYSLREVMEMLTRDGWRVVAGGC